MGDQLAKLREGKESSILMASGIKKIDDPFLLLMLGRHLCVPFFHTNGAGEKETEELHLY